MSRRLMWYARKGTAARQRPDQSRINPVSRFSLRAVLDVVVVIASVCSE